MTRLLLVQLDGLSRPELERNLEEGRMPYLRSLIGGSHRLHSLFSGLPTTTPSVQGELFYGVRQCVPSWDFRERQRGDIVQLLDPEVAARREREVERRGQGLLRGGAAYACLLSGEAEEVHFGSGHEHWLPPGQLLPTLAQGPRLAWEAARETGRALAEALTRPGRWRHRRDELRALPKRVAVNALLHGYFRTHLTADMRRGLPILYVNFLDYDCQAHLRGPHSESARRTLPKLDETLRELGQCSGREGYQLWVFSDHGQEDAEPYSLERDCLLWQYLEPYVGHVLLAHQGPIAHLYFQDGAHPLDHLARILVERHAVPQVAWADADGTVRVHNRHGTFTLPEDGPEVLGPEQPFPEATAQDLVAMVLHPESGRLLALGWDGERTLSFLREHGSHGGPGAEETHAFCLLPAEVRVDHPVLRPLHLREEALRLLGRTAEGGSPPSRWTSAGT